MRKIALGFLLSASLVALGGPSVLADPPTRAIQANAMPGSFADLVQGLLPAVVNISSTSHPKPGAPAQGGNGGGQNDDNDDNGGDDNAAPDMPGIPQLPPGSPLEQLFKQYMQHHGPEQMVPTSSLGSGFIIDADKGYVITNNHVVEGSDDVKVTLHDNTTLPATVIGRDEKVDIAVLQIKTKKKLTAVKFGDSSKSRIGDWVLAIGNPFGLGGTVTAGIVSAESRDIQAGPYDDFIQTDASINRGNSGGPMFNVQGDVIGINTAIFSPGGSGGSVGIGFAIPSNLAKPVIDQILKYGHTRRGWMGVRIQTVTDDIAQSLNLGATRGALIVSVTPTGPAQAAGLKQGDVVLTFDGKDIDATHALPLTVAETEIGRRVRVVYWREGHEAETTVTVGELEKAEKSGLLKDDADADQGPATPSTSYKVPSIGLAVGPLDQDDRSGFNIPDDVQGALVTKVEPMSEAAEKDLEPGDVIVEVNKQKVTDPSRVQALISDAKRSGHPLVLLLVNRGGDVRFIAVKPKDEAAKPGNPVSKGTNNNSEP
jgi:serine protease Do